jgi:hypothetical protein
LTVAVTKYYIHGALFFYSELFSGNNRLDPVQARMHRSLRKDAGVLVIGLGSASATRRKVDGLTTQHLFTVISGFNSRLGE